MQILWRQGGRHMGIVRILLFLFLFLFPYLSPAAAPDQQDRKPAFAGSFYPGEKAALQRAVDRYLTDAERTAEALSGQVTGIVVPHAGYEYSGAVAASAYSRIKGKPFKTVIVLGGTHRLSFRGIAVYPSGSWSTPLGTVPIDKGTAGHLLEKCPFARVFPAAFTTEHSLEVQLPFLQRTLKDFSIVPVVMGSMDPADYAILAETLTNLIRKDPRALLVVASSDMSHFHDYAAATRMDRLTLEQVGTLNTVKLSKGLENGDYELCGGQAVLTLMMTAKNLGAEARVLNYANSGDVTGDRQRVVGYSAVAFSVPSPGEAALGRTDQARLLAIARKTLEEVVSKGVPPKIDAAEGTLAEKKGVFVTLNKHGNLRGCIGYVEPRSPLYTAVSEMTIAAATADPRFHPVAKSELKDIHIEISILTPFRQITDVREIEVGKHGLYLMKGSHSGLLLPQVPVEQGWTRDDFLRQICLKAGLPSQAWKEKDARLYTFSAQVFSE
jgi:MEMO1 family protein